jgi:hypothetical protein
MFNTKKPNFSTLFLNAGAHIQHHYFFNAEPIRKISTNKNPTWYVGENDDPLADVLGIYDMIVGEYLALTDTDMLLATGLGQKPYDHVKFYYRLKNHADFLRRLGIVFSGVFPRMTRDFLIEFETAQQAFAAKKKLARVRVDDQDTSLFGDIDNRGRSLFVTMTYPHEVTGSTHYSVDDLKLPLLPEVSFVAIKNGMHQEEGFAFFTPGIAPYAPMDMAHVAELGASIKRYFGLTCPGFVEPFIPVRRTGWGLNDIAA